MAPLGFGQITGIDLEGEARGVLPSTRWKQQAYREAAQKRWYAGETISLGIGQGYNNFTMLQLAGATATLVSGGQRHAPRLVREVQDVLTRAKQPLARPPVASLGFKPEDVEVILRAMHLVTQEGTSTRVFMGAPYKSLGKTGTAQAVGVRQNEKYNAAKLEEHQRDHSLYIAAAPLEAPTVALAVVVENSGFGAEAAAPIARRVFDYLLLGLYPSEEDIALARQGKAAAPVGRQRNAAEVPLPGQPGAAAAAAAASMTPTAPAAPAAPASAPVRVAVTR
jgi:penicillin-binding protein 2